MQNSIKPVIEGELPSEYADRLGMYYTKAVTTVHKKKEGQFFTPPAIAELMASFCNTTKNEVKILDPGCGTGILTCAIIEHLVKTNKHLTSIQLVAYETDVNLISSSQETLKYLKGWLQEKKLNLNIYYIYTILYLIIQMS
ncbi:MAG: SAM-dependent methyltransferase [Sphingobacteriales bacterium JAD_PAG50586_3]|nr:MAG: SAM-dependent methyltransferase [Sphingobacteriales bacterium JAD_PAG50586_3]